ncbi:MAG TPA: hypothetical protein VKU41_09055, partial [Polyangiaceae bacterium]|nr:hypothetical protein [Polyangiaceae bacterium]
VDAGKQIVTQFRCFACHQSTGLDAGGIVLSGNSNSISDAAPIYPPNLTPDPATGLGCWTDQQIERAFLDGIDDKDASLCVMPHFRARFADAGVDIDASSAELVAFLRSLNPVSHQVPQTMCPPPAEAGAPTDAGDAQADAGEAAAPADAGDASAD